MLINPLKIDHTQYCIAGHLKNFYYIVTLFDRLEKIYSLTREDFMEDKWALVDEIDSNEDKLLSASRALSFFTINGGSYLGNLTNTDEEPKFLPPFCLQYISVPFVEMIVKVVKSIPGNSSDLDMVKEIVITVFQACLEFKITDVNQIAYIFGTMCHETHFGKNMVEDASYLLNLYEPVFSDQKAIEANNPIKPNDPIYNFAKDTEFNLIEEIKGLYQCYKNNDLIYKDLEKKLKELDARLEKIFLQISDAFLTAYLVDLAMELDPKNIIKAMNDFVIKSSNIRHLKPSPRSPSYVTPILTWLKAIDFNKANANVLQFIIIQLKLLLVDWLLTRIDKSKDLGNTHQADGENYKGKGLVQLTGRGHYEKFTKFFNTESSSYYKVAKKVEIQDAIDLEQNPQQATNPKIAAIVTVGGMYDGQFIPPYRLGRYAKGTGSYDFFNARDIVNADKSIAYEHSGQTIGQHVAALAEKFIPALLSFKGK